MSTACNKKPAICKPREKRKHKLIVNDCRRSEIKRLRKTAGEIKAAAVSFTTTSVSRTTLQDLPTEVLDYILMKAVVKKVIDKKLAKPAWIDYASRVIQPMRTVWSQWNCRLTTRWFKIVLSRNLNNKDPTAISVEITAARPYNPRCDGFAKLGNEIYLVYYYPDRDRDDFDYYCLTVFKVQDLIRYTCSIPLPITDSPRGMVACKRSNSLYIWRCGPDVFHVMPNGGFEVQRWPAYSLPTDFLDCSETRGNYYHIDSFSVLDDGNLLVKRCIIDEEEVDDDVSMFDLEEEDIEEEMVLSVHKPDGSVIRNIRLLPSFRSSNVVMKSNGNFVYAQHMIIREIDQDGKEIRNFHWIEKGLRFSRFVQLFVDSYDRVILLGLSFDLVFLDAELNFLKEDHFEPPGLDLELYFYRFRDACFDKEANEMIVCFEDVCIFLKLTS